jgi:hypothetical protein
MAPCKWIVKIEENGIAVEGEVIGDSPQDAEAAAIRMYPDYKPVGIQWSISPSGQRIGCR